MKKKDFLERPAVVTEALNAKRGWHWLVELLIFVAVFIVGSLAQGLVVLPAQMILIFGNADYQAAISSGDLKQAVEVSAQMASTNTYALWMLVSDLMLIVVVYLFCRLFEKRKMRTLGFRKQRAVREYLVGALVGLLFFSAAVLIAVIVGAVKIVGISSTFSAGLFLLYLFGYMIQGMAEEVLCRGYFMVSIARRYPLIAAVVINSLFFAGLHLFNNGITVLAFINLTLFGIYASLYFIRRGNIWGIAAFHSIWNLVQGNLYGIKVSGINITCSLFETVPGEGKELIHGGAFGMEGGIAVTIVLLAGIVFLYTRKNVDPVTEEPGEQSTQNI